MTIDLHIHLNTVATTLWHLSCWVAQYTVITGLSLLCVDLLLTYICLWTRSDPWRWRMRRGDFFCGWNLLNFTIDTIGFFCLLGAGVWLLLIVLVGLLIVFPTIGT